MYSTLFKWVRPHSVVFEKSLVTHRLKQPGLCYCTLFSISLTVFPLLRFDLTSCFVSVWLTLSREGRRYEDKMVHLVIGAWGSVPVKTKTCLQVWSMYVLEICSWSRWLRLAVCFQHFFLCNYRLAMLKGELHAGRRSALGFTREFVGCYSPFCSFFSFQSWLSVWVLHYSMFSHSFTLIKTMKFICKN